MHVAGWWDQEDFYGPVKAYEVLEKSDVNQLNYLVVGPWNHGGWERRDGDKLGNSNGRLSFDSPQLNNPKGFDDYVSDPAHPVPYRSRPIEPTYNPPAAGGSRWYTWLLEDQRFVHQRPDVLSWETEPLKDDVVISGDIVAHLFASTSGTDSDWVVKLIDVYPEEYPKDPKNAGSPCRSPRPFRQGLRSTTRAKPSSQICGSWAG